MWTSTKVDQYFAELLAPEDGALVETLGSIRDAGLAADSVTASQAKLLAVLVAATGTHRALEIGALGGYSTIWLARAVGAGGGVVTLEVDENNADLTEANLGRAGVADRVRVLRGAAADTLPRLAEEGGDPFGLVFIDADKPNIPTYFDWALRLGAPGTVIVVDNVIQRGTVADPASDDPAVVGIRAFVAAAAANPKVAATVLQTIGAKGYDGLAIATVLP